MVGGWEKGAGAVVPVGGIALLAVGSEAEGGGVCCEAEESGSGVEVTVMFSPRFMLFHSASTSIVAPEAEASGFLLSCSLGRSLVAWILCSLCEAMCAQAVHDDVGPLS